MLDPALLGLSVIAGTLYAIYRHGRSLQRRREEAVAAPTTPDPMSPGYGREDKTYGDARYADYALPQDAPLMTELFQPDGDGVFLGLAFGEFDKDWVSHGKEVMFYGGPRHVMTIAPTRAGKGTCAMIPNLLTLTRSVICVDPKGQNAAVTAAFRARISKTYLLNPFNEHGLGTARFNPIAHLRIDQPNVFADVASLAEALILTEGKDPHWPDSARSLCSLLILHGIATKPGKFTLPEIRDTLGMPDELLVKEIGVMAKSRHSFIAELAGQFLGATNEIKNIVSTARTQTKFLSDPLLKDPHTGVLTGDDFRLADFKKTVSTLYVILPSRHMAAYARLLRLVTVSAIDQLTAAPGGLKTMLMLDEFSTLGHLSAVENAFSMAAGYNLQIWPFVQNLNQLRDIYGETRYLDLISGCGILQFFSPNDEFTAEYVSKRIGDYTQFIANESVNDSQNTSDGSGYSHQAGEHNKTVSWNTGTSASRARNFSWAKVGMRLAPWQNVTAMPKDTGLVFLNGLKYPILATRWPYWVMPGMQENAKPDPFHPRDEEGEAAA